MLGRQIPHKNAHLKKRLVAMLSMRLVDPQVLAAFEEDGARVGCCREGVVGYVFGDPAGC